MDKRDRSQSGFGCISDLSLPVSDLIIKIREGNTDIYTYDFSRYSDNGTTLTKSMPVFYNPIQEFNRSLSILLYLYHLINIIQMDNGHNRFPENYEHPEKFILFDSMCATSVRSLRFLKIVGDLSEILRKITEDTSKNVINKSPSDNSGGRAKSFGDVLDIFAMANDLNPTAIRLSECNCRLNNVKYIFIDNPRSNFTGEIQSDGNKIERIPDPRNIWPDPERLFGFINNNNGGMILFNKDLRILLNAFEAMNLYPDIIDIDPFGTPNIFIEPAIKSVKKGGIIAVTATDTAVLFGVREKACIRKYGIKPLRSVFLKETGVRLLLQYIALKAHPYRKGIKPLLSISTDHYVRVFIKIENGVSAVNKNIELSGYIQWCKKCGFRRKVKILEGDFLDKCPKCGNPLDYGGPFWLGEIHDADWIGNMLNIMDLAKAELENKLPSFKRIKKQLELCHGEMNYPPWYYSVHNLCKKYHIPVMKMDDLFEKVKARGFDIARTHFDPVGVKTTMTINDWEDLLENEFKRDAS